MWDQFVLLDRDLVRMTFIVGVAASVLLYERTHLTTGSIVVPGYIGVQLLNPGSLLVTAINSVLTYILVSKVIPKFTVVYGRARFVLNIVVSVTLSVTFATVIGAAAPSAAVNFETIGYVIPALIAYDMNRQGPRKTGSAVALAGVLAAIPALLIVAVRPEIVNQPLPSGSGMLDIDGFWLPFIALISTGMSTMLQSGHRLRCGGFIGAMYLGLSAVNPWNTLYLLAVGLVTYVLVNYGLKPMMIVFGRRKFATTMMVGALLSWSCLEIIDFVHPGGIKMADMPIAALAVPALLANDMERSSVVEVLTGSVLAATATLSLVLVIVGVVDASAIPFWALPALAASMVVLAFPWLAPMVATRHAGLRRKLHRVREHSGLKDLGLRRAGAQ
jgi:poly-gamma-glutamate biosynthesis protein PgsC/CapC